MCDRRLICRADKQLHVNVLFVGEVLPIKPFETLQRSKRYTSSSWQTALSEDECSLRIIRPCYVGNKRSCVCRPFSLPHKTSLGIKCSCTANTARPAIEHVLLPCRRKKVVREIYPQSRRYIWARVRTFPRRIVGERRQQ